MTEGYITFTTGTGGTWIAWHTGTRPPENATGRDMMDCPGPVSFAIGATSEDALAKLRAEMQVDASPGSPS